MFVVEIADVDVDDVADGVVVDSIRRRSVLDIADEPFVSATNGRGAGFRGGGVAAVDVSSEAMNSNEMKIDVRRTNPAAWTEVDDRRHVRRLCKSANVESRWKSNRLVFGV